MHYILMFPSKYVRAADLMGKDVTVEIASVKMEELTMAGGKKDKKPVMTFKGKDKALVLNKTNATTIASGYGSDTKDWVGQPITLYPTKTNCGGAQVDCIRVREPGRARPQSHADTPGHDPMQNDGPSLERGNPADVPRVMRLVEELARRCECDSDSAELRVISFAESFCDGKGLDDLNDADMDKIETAIVGGILKVEKQEA